MVLFSLIITLAFPHSMAWDYDSPTANTSHWALSYAECGYSRQSPIDVPIDITTSCETPLELQWTSESSHYAIRNNGHSLQAVPFIIDHAGGSDISGLEVLHHTNDTNIRLTNSFYNTYKSSAHQEYCFDSLHFHWASTNDKGSEHTINGISYPLELHLVHYSCDYHVASTAIHEYASGAAKVKYDDDNVLAVIGIMFEIGAPNPVLSQILDDIIIDGIYEHKANDAEYPHYLEMYYTEFDVRALLPESMEMVAYLGSLTTPPCFETVRWHLMKQTMTVSEEQMEAFRALLTSSNMSDNMAPNYRPVQPRNGREIWQCQEDVERDMVIGYNESDDNMNVTQMEDIWKGIAIGFIALFTCSCISCFVVMFAFCDLCERVKRKSSKGDKLEDEVIEIESNHHQNEHV